MKDVCNQVWSVRATYIWSWVFKIVLFALFFIPPLFFTYGSINGKIAFINYSEPKLVAWMVLSWLLISIFWLYAARTPQFQDRLKIVFQDKLTWLWMAFLVYLCITAIHTLVIEAAIYELVQFFSLFVLYVVLVPLFAENKFLKLSIWAILISFMLVTIVGFLQFFGLLPFFKAIHGPVHPSTFGYKNPASLALLGQLFLLAGLGVMYRGSARPWLSWILWFIMAVEIVYLATLQSRTAYFAVFVSALWLAIWIIFKLKKNYPRLIKLSLVAIGITSLLFSSVVFFYRPAWDRVEKILIYVKDPISFIKSDRGTYLVNSINMANKNLLGVGIGNWGFAYPVYRTFQPDMYFDENVQVRRAHGDYAQMLGETGWFGLVLWLSLLGWVFVRGVRVSSKSQSLFPMFVTVQYGAFLLVMLFDFCIEMPYHKFAFYALIAMVMSATLKNSQT